eukprot:CCRYP_004865-RA/>CCRYP_004865-RA protein AED:0.11 eAED:0.11 QI:111/1/1/1/1/1/2/92/605
MSLNGLSPEEYDAANFIAGLSSGITAKACGSKRERDARDADNVPDTSPEFSPRPSKAKKRVLSARKDKSDLDSEQTPPPKAAPYFFYTDHSREVDRDPLSPVTPPGAVPIFPVKMHVLLSKPELCDILAWDSHGRSFRILKPRQFEAEILPQYFDHSNFASLTRQLNGWGFRRLTEGENMGSYYEEHFLRSMPWLCKQMKRPKVGEKISICPRHEPDLVAISKDFPVPNYPMTREIKVVMATMARGPKAKVPEQWFLEGEDSNPNLPLPNSCPAPVPVLYDDSDEEKKPAARLDRHLYPSSVLASATRTAAAVTSAQPMASSGTNALNDFIRSLQQRETVGSMSDSSSTRHVNIPAAAPLSPLSIQNLLKSLQQSDSLGSMASKPYTHYSVPAPAPQSSTSIQDLLRSLPHRRSVGSTTDIRNTFQVSVPAATPSSSSLVQSMLQSLQQSGSLGSMTRMPRIHQSSVPVAAPLSSSSIQTFLHGLQMSDHVGSMTARQYDNQRNHAGALSVPIATVSTDLLNSQIRSLQQVRQVLSMSGSSSGLPMPTTTAANSQRNSHHPTLAEEQVLASIQGIVNSRMSLKDVEAHLSAIMDPSSLPFRRSQG